MLSRGERFYARNPSSYSPRDQYRFRHKIKKKMLGAIPDLRLVLDNWDAMKLDPALLESFPAPAWAQISMRNDAEPENGSAKEPPRDKYSKYEDDW